MFRKLFISWKNKISMFLLIILGYFLTITIFSMLLNQAVIDNKSNDNRSFGKSYNRSVLSILSNYKYDFDGDPSTVINEFSKYGEVDVLKLGKESIAYGNENIETQIYPVTFNKEPDWTPLMLKGRYLTPDECVSGKNYIILGKNVAEKINISLNDEIDFYGKKFKVIGIMGLSNQWSNWDNTSVISFNALPSQYLDFINQSLIDSTQQNKMLKMQILVRVNSKDMDTVINKVNTKLNNYNLNVSKTQDDFPNNSFNLDSFVEPLILSVPIILVALFNVINISFFWIKDRKKEITIKKVVGANNKFIISEIRKEMFFIVFISTLLSILFQIIFNRFFDGIFSKAGLSFNFSWITFIIAVLTSLFMGYMATILPAKKIISIEPAEALRYE